MILVNGSKGIGTGFSTEILPYNPIDIINLLLNKLQDKDYNDDLIPYYNKFIGSINEISSLF